MDFTTRVGWNSVRIFVIAKDAGYTLCNIPEIFSPKDRMKIDSECPSCIERMVRQTVDMATDDAECREVALAEAFETMHKALSPDKVPTQVAGEIQRVIRLVTGNRDPHRKWKDREMGGAKEIFAKVRPRYGNEIRSLVTLSAIGNALDFFRDIGTVEHEMLRPVSYRVDHINNVTEFLEGARSTLFMSDESMDNLMCFVPSVNLCMKRVMVLADNAGECYFDQPLVKELSQVMGVTYVVKSSPVQNDLTEEDLLLSGLYESMGARIVTSADTAGTDMSLVSPSFRSDFESSDMIIAKGMGNWETLSELPAREKVFHLLSAKCPPVARSMGVPVGSYVAMLR